MKLNNRP